MRYLPVVFPLVSLLILLSACGGGSSGTDEFLTAQENSDRVGEQIVRCGVEQFDAAAVDGINQTIADVQSTASRRLLGARGVGTINVPTIFHIIAAGPSEAEGNISDAAIAEQMAVLNAGFAGTPFVFSLLETTRFIEPAFHDLGLGSLAEIQVKNSLRRGGPETLNVYVAQPSDGVLGYATLPWMYLSEPVLDGVVVSFRTFPGGSLPPYNEGDTLTHEVGHWYGLFHTFQGGCDAPGDDVADTSAELEPSFGCPVGRDSCAGAGRDPVNNFMDYSDDSCLFEFSPQQIERMDILSAIFRA